MPEIKRSLEAARIQVPVGYPLRSVTKARYFVWWKNLIHGLRGFMGCQPAKGCLGWLRCFDNMSERSSIISLQAWKWRNPAAQGLDGVFFYGFDSELNLPHQPRAVAIWPDPRPL